MSIFLWEVWQRRVLDKKKKSHVPPYSFPLTGDMPGNQKGFFILHLPRDDIPLSCPYFVTATYTGETDLLLRLT